jgi:hypothetical protein
VGEGAGPYRTDGRAKQLVKKTPTGTWGQCAVPGSLVLRRSSMCSYKSPSCGNGCTPRNCNQKVPVCGVCPRRMDLVSVTLYLDNTLFSVASVAVCWGHQVEQEGLGRFRSPLVLASGQEGGSRRRARVIQIHGK